VIAVVGSPVGRRSPEGIEAAGFAVAIARSAAADGVTVQLIGKLGDGADGDAILLSLAQAGIGHVALLRQPGPVPVAVDPSAGEGDEGAIGFVVGGDVEPESNRPALDSRGASLDAADLELALRYLPEYDVVVVGQPLEPAAMRAVVDAATWAGARLVLAGGTSTDPLPDDATVLDPPSDDADGAFASVVGRYAAALSRGTPPADAFAAASAAVGWSPVTD